jgi:hypothetical protein
MFFFPCVPKHSDEWKPFFNKLTAEGYLREISSCWNVDRDGKVNKRLFADKWRVCLVGGIEQGVPK